MSRDVFTRAEVAKVLGEALFMNTMGASRSLVAKSEFGAGAVLQKMAERMRSDPELLAKILDRAEAETLGPLLVLA